MTQAEHTEAVATERQTSKHQPTADQVELFLHKLSCLSQRRKVWESTARDELYAILTDCFKFYQVVQRKPALIAQVRAFLQTENLPMRKDSSPAVLIVRAVFGDCGPKAFTYAKLLELAYQENPDETDLRAFIKRNGGLDAIRRANVKGITSGSDDAAAFRKMVASLPHDPERPSGIQITDEVATSEEGLTLLLVQRDDSGEDRIVYATGERKALTPFLKKAVQAAGGAEGMADDAEGATLAQVSMPATGQTQA
ncbi:MULTISPECIES: hypothetical protein [Halocynthiibacter]|uniref:Uncharacterized protein n=1 Tax=Halocynthiibacter halioticoli TaxID=2986804 RepID=A0AAE3J2D0_9RHOB|nr:MULTISPECIES: hypothetical protein [Halocynthiibacter]MCV6825398.1 hypothetical protein [Halocynthiibacter halioticoli]MCW4058399.1 hypothetical protein [Halocynthiibacter sp. SDUM655004]